MSKPASEPATESKPRRKLDPEIAAMQKIAVILGDLAADDPAAVSRVIQWMNARQSCNVAGASQEPMVRTTGPLSQTLGSGLASRLIRCRHRLTRKLFSGVPRMPTTVYDRVLALLKLCTVEELQQLKLVDLHRIQAPKLAALRKTDDYWQKTVDRQQESG